MSFFKRLTTVAGNWLEIKNLDTSSDLHISNICGFEAWAIDSRTRQIMSDEVKRLCVSNLLKPYTTEEMALIKLTEYSKLLRDNFGTEHNEFKKVQNGIRKTLNSIGDTEHSGIKLDARIELDTW